MTAPEVDDLEFFFIPSPSNIKSSPPSTPESSSSPLPAVTSTSFSESFSPSSLELLPSLSPSSALLTSSSSLSAIELSSSPAASISDSSALSAVMASPEPASSSLSETSSSSLPVSEISSSSSASLVSPVVSPAVATALVSYVPVSSSVSRSATELEYALQQLKEECERSQRDAVWTPAELEMLSELTQTNVEDLFCESLKTSNWQYFRSKVMQIYPFYERVSLLSSDPRLHGRLTELLMIQTKVRPELLQYCLGDGRNGRHDRLALDRFDARLGFLLFDYIKSMPSVLCGIIEAYVQFDFRLQVKEWLYKNINIWIWMRGSHSSWLTRVLYSDEHNLLEALQKEFDVMTPVVKFTKRLSQEEKDSLAEIVSFIVEKLSNVYE